MHTIKNYYGKYNNLTSMSKLFFYKPLRLIISTIWRDWRTILTLSVSLRVLSVPYFVLAQLVEEASATNAAKYFMNQGNRSSDKERERLNNVQNRELSVSKLLLCLRCLAFSKWVNWRPKILSLLPNADVLSESLDSFCVKNISVLKM